MGIRVIRYHPEKDRDGHEFDLDNFSLDILAEEGWVDSPAKFGHSPTGDADPRALAAAKAIYEQSQGGRKAGQPSYEEMQRQIEGERAKREAEEKKAAEAVAEKERLHEELRVAQTRLEAAAEKAEQAADEKADAVRGRTSGKTATRARTPKTPAAKK